MQAFILTVGARYIWIVSESLGQLIDFHPPSLTSCMLNGMAEESGWGRSKSWGHFTAVAMIGNLGGLLWGVRHLNRHPTACGLCVCCRNEIAGGRY